jgi:hypothetical protein
MHLAAPHISVVANDPDLLLHQLDFLNAKFQFLKVCADSYRDSVFLDERILHSDRRIVEFPVAELLDFIGREKAPTERLSFIFHTSFCCSTLLARSLDVAGRTLVLREPWAIYQFSAIRQQLLDSGQWNRDHHNLLDAVLTLLSKTYAPTEQVVIKPSNLANAMIGDLLSLRPRARALLLYSDLENFIISQLKKPEATRMKIPRLAASVAAMVKYRDYFPQIVPGALPHLHAVAVLWHAQMMLFAAQLERYPQNLRTLSMEKLLAEPEASLQASIHWLRLPLNYDHVASVVKGPIWRSHAKVPELPYDVAAREDENRKLLAQYDRNISEALRWIEPFLAAKPVGMVAACGLDGPAP